MFKTYKFSLTHLCVVWLQVEQQFDCPMHIFWSAVKQDYRKVTLQCSAALGTYPSSDLVTFIRLLVFSSFCYAEAA